MVDVCVLGPSKSFLQEALVRDLDPRAHQGGDDVVFDFSIGVLRLGSIAIPRQSFLTQNALYDCEHMVFNLWNCLPEHRPLGSVAVYLASRQVRRKLNMVGHEQRAEARSSGRTSADASAAECRE
jgi:hypothetical protein